jgi:hypothetical protein
VADAEFLGDGLLLDLCSGRPAPGQDSIAQQSPDLGASAAEGGRRCGTRVAERFHVHAAGRSEVVLTSKSYKI